MSPLKLLHTIPRSIAIPMAILMAAPALGLALEEPSETDCQCRDPTGNMRNLGTVECVNVTGERYLVRCEMSTNTPYWKKIEDGTGCPIT